MRPKLESSQAEEPTLAELLLKRLHSYAVLWWSGHGEDSCSHVRHSAKMTEQERWDQRKAARLALDTSAHAGSEYQRFHSLLSSAVCLLSHLALLQLILQIKSCLDSIVYLTKISMLAVFLPLNQLHACGASFVRKQLCPAFIASHALSSLRESRCLALPLLKAIFI